MKRFIIVCDHCEKLVGKETGVPYNEVDIQCVRYDVCDEGLKEILEIVSATKDQRPQV